ncbi:restriction endonuclease subunit S [Duganella sp. BJB1802]|uniref:restriction endonuclease subunit S n=1 Tax=Duganella sp. BJB1802 TaxID=2744575 RepID=UPI001594E4E9|nr:restriction endonuclease subunit S [Duganella sp. BJB1802]NVD73653.1 restriction endonuclease subunit S [Duganella sp. BJB1802]
MSRIADLIAEYGPNCAEFRLLGEVAAYSNTRVLAASVDAETFVGVDNLLSNQAGRVASNCVPNKGSLSAYQSDDILIGNIRPYLKKIWLASNSGGCSGDVLAVRIVEAYQTRLLPTFLYWILSSDAFFDFNMRHAKGAKMPRGSKAMILKYRIPVPPLEVQREIVKVLEAFSELEKNLDAELRAELVARQLQYRYYRDALFAFADRDTLWVTMAEVGRFFRGRRFTRNDLSPMGLACIHYGDIYTHYGTAATVALSYVHVEMASALRFAEPSDLVIAGVGETVEDVGKAVAWLGDGKVAIHDDCFVFRHSLNPKFVSYYFQTAAFHAEKNKFVARAKVKRLSGESLAKMAIPVPPVEEQERIVAILDQLEARVNDLSVALPTELTARRQQYEHYRDRLLTFPETA